MATKPSKTLATKTATKKAAAVKTIKAVAKPVPAKKPTTKTAAVKKTPAVKAVKKPVAAFKFKVISPGLVSAFIPGEGGMLLLARANARTRKASGVEKAYVAMSLLGLEKKYAKAHKAICGLPMLPYKELKALVIQKITPLL